MSESWYFAVGPAELSRMKQAVDTCVVLASDFLRMGQPGYEAPAYYTNPPVVPRSYEGMAFEGPVEPLREAVFEMAAWFTGEERERALALEPEQLNEIFGEATRSLMSAFSPEQFENFVAAQSSDVAGEIRGAGSGFVALWADELMRHTAGAEIVLEFVRSPLFELYHGAKKDGDPLLTRIMTHIVDREGALIEGRRSPAYEDLLRHTAALLARDEHVATALHVIAWHTPAELRSLLDVEHTAAKPALFNTTYETAGNWLGAIGGIVARIPYGLTPDHVELLEALSRPFLETVEGCCWLLRVYDEQDVVPPDELLATTRAFLADPTVLPGGEGSINYDIRWGLMERLDRA